MVRIFVCSNDNANRPRDQELRFTVRDSPDYYTLKISIFNDDKKTELIGEAWVDLKPVIVSGGGQRDLWQDLKYRGKYAGEVRIELTYYDSRPKEEKPAPRQQADFADDSNLAGPREYTPARRRPLPANPGSASSADPSKPFIGGARSYGNQPQPQSLDNTPSQQGRKTFPDDPLYMNDRRRTLPPKPGHVQHDYPESNYAPSSIDPGSTYDQHDQYDQYHEQSQYDFNDQQFPDDGFLPQLPPMTNKNRGGSSLRGSFTESHNNLHQAYSQSQEQEYLPQSSRQQSHVSGAPSQNFHGQYGPESFAQPSRHNSDHWEQESNASHQIFHPQPRRSFILEDQDNMLSDPPQPVQDQGWNGQMHEPMYTQEPVELDAPPPPPVHRRPVPQPHAHSSPGYGERPREWDHQEPTNEHWDVGPAPNFREQLTSKSEVTLPRFSDQESFHSYPDHQQPHQMPNPVQFEPYRPSYHEQAFTSEAMDASYNQPPHRGSFGDDLPQTPSRSHYESRRSSGDDRRNSVNSHSSAESMSRMTRYRPSPILPPTIGSSPLAGLHSLNASANVSPSRPHPLSREHIISSSPEQSHHSSHYEHVPVIKPLTIPAHKMRTSVSQTSISSHDGYQSPSQYNYPQSSQQPSNFPNSPHRPLSSYQNSPGRQSQHSSHPNTPSRQQPMQIIRKSVSPQVSSSPLAPPNYQAEKPFVPFSPASFDELNPNYRDSIPKSANNVYTSNTDPSVDFHGNIIDPSNHLPQKSWPPVPDSQDAEDNHPDSLPRSSWAPEPEHSKKVSEARRIRVQVRARDREGRLHGARSMDFGTLKSNSSSGYNSPTSMADAGSRGNNSPVDTPSPSVRNRLIKKSVINSSRPQSVAVVSSWNQPITNIPPPPQSSSLGNSPTSGRVRGLLGYGDVPEVPAKIPLDSHQRSSPANAMAMNRYYAHKSRHEGEYDGTYESRGNSYSNSYDTAPGRSGDFDDIARLSAELSSIDIGGSSSANGSARGVGGRRLLAYRN
jgi:hypothetical protein